MSNKDSKNNAILWMVVAFPFAITYFLYYFIPVFLNALNQMQFPFFVPRFDPIGIDLRWLWQIEKDWIEGGFVYPEKGSEHFPPVILLFFAWCGKLSFEATYKVFSVVTLAIYLITSIAIPYLIEKKCNLDKSVWLISIPFALFGLSTYGFQFEIERGQWNLFACCLAIWGVYLNWRGGNILKGFAIVLLTIAIQLKLYPAIYVLAFFACRKNLKEGIVTLFVIAIINIGLLFIFGFEGFSIFIDSVVLLGKHTSYGVAQTSISSFLWLVDKNLSIYLPIIKLLLILYFGLVLFVLYLMVVRYPVKKEDMASLIFLLTIIGLIVPTHSNDYKLSLMPLIASIFSVQITSIIRIRKKVFFVATLMAVLFFCIFSTFYSYATKNDNIFIQNNVTNLLLSSVCICIISIFIMNREKQDKCMKNHFGV